MSQSRPACGANGSATPTADRKSAKTARRQADLPAQAEDVLREVAFVCGVSRGVKKAILAEGENAADNLQ
jgi:hypothetical protein